MSYSVTVTPSNYVVTLQGDGSYSIVAQPQTIATVSVAAAQGPTGPTGATGATGAAGSNGVGVPAGGNDGQVLAKASNTDYDTEWVDGGGGGGSGWLLTGNSGTTAGTDFLGTTDDEDLVIKRNSVEIIRVADASKVGIQNNTPQNPLHVAATVGTTINSVVTASVAGAAVTLDASPTGTITTVAEFPAPTGSSTTYENGGGYTAEGQTIDYQLYPAIYDGSSIYYTSQYFDTTSYTDPLNDFSSFSVVITLPSAATNQTHWLILKQVNGGGFGESAFFPVGATATDTNFGGSVSSTAWPTQYTISYITPVNPASGVSVGWDIGTPSITADGTTYNVEVRSYTNINGTGYSDDVNSVDTGSLTDPNDSSFGSVATSWAGSTGEGYILRISPDGGTTWYYYDTFTNASFTYEGQTNTPTQAAAETIWNNGISSFTGITYSYRCYGKTLSPAGVTVYNPTATNYTATISTPNIGHIFLHIFSGMPSGGGKILADYNTSITNGQDVTGNFLDIGFNSWASGTTITPTTFGFSSGTTRYFKLVGSGSGIFSSTPLVVNATTSGTQYFLGSFSYPSGITTVKILLSTDGVTYTSSKTFNSPTTAFSYDSTDNSWSGNTTISPTTLVPGAVRIDRSQTAISDVPHLSIVDVTGSGTRYASIGFGLASNSSSAPTYSTNIISDFLLGYLGIGASRVVGYTSPAQTNQSWTLGNSIAFNLQKSSTVHTTIWGGDATNPMMYAYSAGDSNRGTVYFGQNSTSFGTGSKVVIAPSAGGTPSLHLRNQSGSENTNAIFLDVAGTTVGGWTKGGRVFLNASASSSSTWLLIGASSSGTQIRLGAGNGTGTTEGDVWNDLNAKCLNFFLNGIRQYGQNTLSIQTSTVTCASTTSETTITSPGTGFSNTLPASFFVVGKSIRIRAWGILSSTASPSLTMKVKLGSTVICTTGAHTAHNTTNNLWNIDAIITCRSVGGSGTVFGQAVFYDTTDSVSMTNTATTTINTTTTQLMTITAQWSASSSSNTISCTNLIMETLA